MNGKSTAQVLRTAAEIIQSQGLTKGTYENEAGAHCTLGALDEATARLNLNWDTHDQCVDVLNQLLGGDSPFAWYGSISRWNDLEATTKEDVATLLTTAAEKIEADLP